MAELVIGCPVSHREWIMERWFDHIDVAAKEAGVDPAFLFIGNPKTDPETFGIIRRRSDARIIHTEEPERQDRRKWEPDRKELLVDLRNRLLREVRETRPDYYLSLDSDILIGRAGIQSLIEAFEHGPWAAVGGKTYMTHLPQGAAIMNPRVGTQSPSCLMFGRNGNYRPVDTDGPGLFRVDCIMAIKMMKPDAYAIDYKYHRWGEDVGWSQNCRDAGVWLGWDARVVHKHVMRPQDLDRYDPRCGY